MSYKPVKTQNYGEYVSDNDLGWLLTEFDAYEPNPQFPWDKRVKPQTYDAWPIVVPVKAPPVVWDLEQIMYKMIKATWTIAEPKAGVERGKAGARDVNAGVIGTRGMPQSLAKQFLKPTYSPQVRPTETVLETRMPDTSAIAQDWYLHRDLNRTNAVTFRADKRPPREVIAKQGGFHPPVTRKDRNYLEFGIYNAFSTYLERRYKRTIDKETFLAAVDRQLVSPQAKELVYEYLVWLSITKKESAHLGRMVENQALKGWISTARALDSSLTFAMMGPPGGGWVYVTVVHSGYVVPYDHRQEIEWGTAESEIAQFGSIPKERIVGFAKYCYAWDSPIFLRKTFREREPKAFEYMHKALSGMTPASPGYTPPQ